MSVVKNTKAAAIERDAAALLSGIRRTTRGARGGRRPERKRHNPGPPTRARITTGRSIDRRSVTPGQVRDAMTAVADLFEAVPECHCGDFLAMTEQGVPVHPLAPVAAQWCLYGALFAALEISEPYGPAAALVRTLADAAARSLFGMRAADANNGLGREAAVAILRCAATSMTTGASSPASTPRPGPAA